MSNFFITEALAHEEEIHETLVESTTHYFEFLSDPWYAIPLAFVAVGLLTFLLKRLHVNASHILLVVVITLFVLSIFGFLFVPPLGIVSISIGFVLTGLLVFSGIGPKN